MSDNKSSYGNIFKTTFLFGFVQLIRAIVGIVKNKIIAILLGPSGLGIITIYLNTTNLIKTGASLGISQSAVKDISEANATNDERALAKIICIVNRAVVFTSLLGFIITIVLSPWLSKWNFSDSIHTYSFIALSISVSLEIMVENMLAILKGIRHLKTLAQVSVLTSIVAIVVGVPFFFFWGEDGIIPSLISSSVVSVIITYFFIKKIRLGKTSVSFKETITSSMPMVNTGISLMLSNFMSYMFILIVLSYIQKVGNMHDVGLYNAGSVLVISYFSMITNALNTDYYPRISAISNNNKELQNELYKQSLTGLLLVNPLAVIFTIFTPVVILILYSNEFQVISQYTDIAIMGIILSVVSNCFGYIIIVKRDMKIYLSTSILFNIVFVGIYCLFYKYWGLSGLGYGYLANVLCQLIVYGIICQTKYGISLPPKIVLYLVIGISFILITSYIRREFDIICRVCMDFSLMLLLLFISNREMKLSMNIDIISIIKKKIK